MLELHIHACPVGALYNPRDASYDITSHVQVLDVGQVVAGNFCGGLLAYFGADVIKVWLHHAPDNGCCSASYPALSGPPENPPVGQGHAFL